MLINYYILLLALFAYLNGCNLVLLFLLTPLASIGTLYV